MSKLLFLVHTGWETKNLYVLTIIFSSSAHFSLSLASFIFSGVPSSGRSGRKEGGKSGRTIIYSLGHEKSSFFKPGSFYG